ncbi:MAG: AMP-binding protein [Anaerolineae bacterium]|nr:AMP-binding protein [Anaerolineae bacterium]
MAEQIGDSGATFAITLTLFYENVKRIQAQTKVQHVIATGIKEYLPPSARALFTLAKEKKEGAPHRQAPGRPLRCKTCWLATWGRGPDVDVQGDDTAIFQYTGGTTGIPKAAMSTHSALAANTVQCQAWLAREGVAGELPGGHPAVSRVWHGGGDELRRVAGSRDDHGAQPARHHRCGAED